jgi:hypothetical protein
MPQITLDPGDVTIATTRAARPLEKITRITPNLSASWRLFPNDRRTQKCQFCALPAVPLVGAPTLEDFQLPPTRDGRVPCRAQGSQDRLAMPLAR